MTTRRMLVLVAVLMGITAIAAGLASPPPRTQRAAPEPQAQAPVRAGQSSSELVERSVRLAKPSTVALDQGDLARVTVTGDALDVVELVGLDLFAPIAPETPAVFDLLADSPGRYPLRLVQSGQEVGAVRIVPAEE